MLLSSAQLMHAACRQERGQLAAAMAGNTAVSLNLLKPKAGLQPTNFQLTGQQVLTVGVEQLVQEAEASLEGWTAGAEKYLCVDRHNTVR